MRGLSLYVCGGEGIGPDPVFELLASLVARSLVVAEGKRARDQVPVAGNDPPVRRQSGEQRLEAADETERWRARRT
jgi:hypothetical protein